MTSELSLEQLRPYLRIALHIYLKYTQKPRMICACDHRIFYAVSGLGKVRIGQVYQEVKPGRLFYWMSGTPYCFLPDPGQTLHMLAVNFDFTQAHADQVHPLPMVPAEDAEKARLLERLRITDAPALEHPVLSDDLADVVPWLRTMVRESEMPQLHSRLLSSGLLTAVIARLAQGGRHPAATASATAAAILDYVNQHYRQPLSNRMIAEQFGYHPNYISQLIRTHTGLSLHQYLLQVRIRHAVHMLENTPLSVGQIAELCGFRSVSYFCEYFKQATGFTPGAFRVR